MLLLVFLAHKVGTRLVAAGICTILFTSLKTHAIPNQKSRLKLTDSLQFKIVGTIHESYKGYKLHLRARNIKDSCIITGPKFYFSNTIAEPSMATLILVNEHEGINSLKRQSLTIYLDKGEIRMKVTDSLAKAKVTGSVEHDRYLIFQKMIAPVITLYKAYNASVEKTATDATKKQGSDSDSIVTAIREKEAEIIEHFIRKYPASFVCLFALRSAGIGKSANPFIYEGFFSELEEKVKNSFDGQRLFTAIRNAQNQFMVESLPEFTMTDTSGNTLRLTDIKSEYVLLDFWASWCIPCRQQFPALKNIYNDIDRASFEIVGISLDRAREDWIEAINKEQTGWINTSELNGMNNSIARFFGITGIPVNILIDKTGKIIERNLEPIALLERLTLLTKKK